MRYYQKIKNPDKNLHLLFFKGKTNSILPDRIINCIDWARTEMSGLDHIEEQGFS